MNFKTLLALCVVFCWPGWALAQYKSYGYTFSNPVTAQCNTNFWSGMNSRLIYRMILKKHGYTDAQLSAMRTEQMYDLIQSGDKGRRAEKSQPQEQARAAAPENPASRFEPTAKRLLLPNIVKSLTEDRAYQGALLEVFEAGFQAYEKEARMLGLSNDLAGSIAFFIGCAYTVYRDGNEPNATGLEMLARALQQQFNTPDFRRIPDSDKQKFHELMITLATYLLAARQTAVETKDAPLAATLRAAAAEALKGFLKIDPARFQITANGVELAR